MNRILLVILWVLSLVAACVYMTVALRHEERAKLFGFSIVEQTPPDWLRVLTKGGVTVMLGLLAWWRGDDLVELVTHSTTDAVKKRRASFALQRRWIRCGVVFSLGGDLALLWGEDKTWFIAGLASFLVAHVFFILAFSVHVRLFADWKLFIFPSVNSLIVMGVFNWPKVVEMQMGGPTVAYTVVLSVMVGQAHCWYRIAPSRESLNAFIGAVLFQFSDGALSLNMFNAPIPYIAIIVHVSYWGAIALLGHSLPPSICRNEASTPIKERRDNKKKTTTKKTQ